MDFNLTKQLKAVVCRAAPMAFWTLPAGRKRISRRMSLNSSKCSWLSFSASAMRTTFSRSLRHLGDTSGCLSHRTDEAVVRTSGCCSLSCSLVLYLVCPSKERNVNKVNADRGRIPQSNDPNTTGISCRSCSPFLCLNLPYFMRCLANGTRNRRRLLLR